MRIAKGQFTLHWRGKIFHFDNYSAFKLDLSSDGVVSRNIANATNKYASLCKHNAILITSAGILHIRLVIKWFFMQRWIDIAKIDTHKYLYNKLKKLAPVETYM